MTVIPFAEWRPDMPALGPYAREALNVVPAAESYRPLNALATTSSALTARAQGAAWFRGTDGTVKMLAGDATKLYRLNGTTWVYAPKLDGARNITAITQANPGVVTYTGADPSNGDTVYITGVVGMTQVNGLFFTVAGVNAGANTFQLSGVNTTGYTAYSSGGTVQKATIYAPGADGNWRFTQFGALAIAVDGVSTPQKFNLSSGTNFEDLGGSPPAASFIGTVSDFVVLAKIGNTRQRVQWSGFNNAEAPWTSDPSTQADLQDLPDGGEVTGFVGGDIGRVFQENAIRRMSYEGPPTVFRFDKIANDLGCSVPNSIASVSDRDFFLHKSGFHMLLGAQQVVPIGRDKVDVTFWGEFDESNQSRCSSAIDPVRGLYVMAYPAHGSSGTPNRLLIYEWSKQRWTRAFVTCELIFSGVSQQSVTLEGLDSYSATLEGLPYSLDSSFWSGALSMLLYGFDTDHKSGSFSGQTLEATIDTGEFNPGNGSRSVIRGLRPLIDGGSPTIRLGAREVQQNAVTFADPVSLTPAGMAPVYGSGRYFRVRAVIPAGDTWSNAQGIDDLDVRKAGGQ